ncbi:reverse transcriptase domain-containing protein [Tanacetum coccineum]
MEAQYGKFFDMIRAVQINVPLIDVLAGMPNYGKFLKELIIAKNMLVKVDKFTFSVDFVILEMEEDSKVPLILGRPFLYTVDEVIRAKQKQLNLGVGTERDFTGPLGPPSGLKGLLHMLNAIVIPTKPYRLCTCGGAWILNKLRGSITNWTSWMLYFWLIMLHVMLDIVRGSRLGAWL